MVAALVIFMATAMASADDPHGWGAIQGTYAMTATGNCLWAPEGFYPNDFSPNGYSAHFVAQGLWTFDPNGTGAAQVLHSGMSAPPIVGAPGGNLYAVSAATQQYTLEFTYTVTHDGQLSLAPTNLQATFVTGPNATLTYTTVPVRPDPIIWTGMVSKDHKTLTLNSGNEIQFYTYRDQAGTTVKTCYGMCNSARVLIRVNDGRE